ncbi:MAG: alanine racemase [Trueperaceae bacterium]|nr:alanine racemase [Trueperaceae bacterium]
MSTPSRIAAGTPLSAIPTPAAIVDEGRLDANLDRAQAYADANDVALRPHAKTHKSPALAREQIARGAVGICVAKLGEAETFAAAGIDDLVMANTTFGAENARRAARLAARVRFAIGADHPDQLRALSAAATDEGVELRVRVEVDTGAGRGGQPPEAVPALVALGRELPGLRLEGLYTYEGYTYDAADVTALTERHREAQATMTALAEKLAADIDAPPVVSMGSTPSLAADVPLAPGITEIRPGTSIFFDAAQAALAGGLHHCAAQVLATVVSRIGSRAILDAGSKSLTTDTRAEGVCATRGHGVLLETGGVIARLSEEHGVVVGDDAEDLVVGQRVRIVPNHVCPVVNLFDRLIVVRDGEVTRVLPVATRGRVD